MIDKILIAEDSPTALNIAQKAFEKIGYDVVTATDGIQALEMAYQSLPHAIILDLIMPRMNGFQVLRLLKEDEYFKKIPIIMLTGRDQSANTRWSSTLGADAYFVKPQGMTELTDTVREIHHLLKNRIPAEKDLPTSPARKKIYDGVTYAFDVLYHKLFASTLRYDFSRRTENLLNLNSLQWETLKFLEYVFGTNIYFFLFDHGDQSSLYFLSPLPHGSSELNYCHKLLTSEFSKLKKGQVSHPCLVENSLITTKLPYEFDVKDSHYRLEFIQPRTSGAGILGVMSNAPLIAEIPEAIRLISKVAAEQATDILIRQEMEHYAPLKAYNQLFRTLNSSKTLQQIRENGLTELANYSQSQAALLFEWEGEVLVPQSSFGLSSPDLLNQSVTPGHSLVGRVAQTKEPIILEGTTGDHLISIDTGMGRLPAKSLILLPVLFREDLLGVMVLASLENHSSEMLENLYPMASQFAISLANAHSLARSTQLAQDLEKQNEDLKAQYREIQKQQEKILTQQRELDQKNRELKEANHHKSAFLASMSHELRTPLNAMIGYTSITLSALREDLPPQHLKNLSSAEQSARTLLELINNVLDLSKIEAGRMDLFLERFDLSEVVESCLIIAKGLLIDSSVELVFDAPSDLPPIENDYTKIKQMINNLLSNAIKFTEEGSVTVSISPHDENTLSLEVIDTGCGIPEEQLENIFLSFRQVDGSIKKKYGGTGLGLAITRKLGQLLGVNIDLESEVGRGSTFRLLVPVDFQGEMEHEGLPETSEPSSPSVPDFTPSTPMVESRSKTRSKTPSPERIGPDLRLLVVGSQEIRQGIVKSSQDLPYEPIFVATIDDIVNRLNEGPVAAIFVEEDSPILSDLKTDDRLSSIPTVVISRETTLDKDKFSPHLSIPHPFQWDQILDTLSQVSPTMSRQASVYTSCEDRRNLLANALIQRGYSVFQSPDVIEIPEVLPRFAIWDGTGDEEEIVEKIKQLSPSSWWSKLPQIILVDQIPSAEEDPDEKYLHWIALSDVPEEWPQQIETALDEASLPNPQVIQIVDDNLVNLTLMEEILRNAGYLVLPSQSGHDALEAFPRLLPDVVLMDLAMPEMDGFETIERILQLPGGDRTTIIACTAFASPQDQEKARRAGCNGYITKPIEPERLITQMRFHYLKSRVRSL